MKNSFVVQYAVHLAVAAFGLSGIPATLFAFVATRILGVMLDRGIIVLDIQIDRIKEALKDPQWRAAAEKAYMNATARVYTEEEKIAIRKQYLDALAKYATYGNGLPDNKNSKR